MEHLKGQAISPMNGKSSIAIFFVFLALITALLLYVLSPFFYPIFWAAVIAGVFRPIHVRLKRKIINKPNLNATLSLAIVILIFIIPMVLIGTLLFQESAQIYSRISEKGTSGLQERVQGVIDGVRHNRFVRNLNIDEQYLANKLSEMASAGVTFVFDSLKKWAQNVVLFIIMFVIMLYLLFYFIRDGDKLLGHCLVVSPLGRERTSLLYGKFISTTRAALKSTLILGGIQGAVGGFLFWITGIEAVLIWGLVMILAAMLPTGSAIVWGPAGIIMLVTGHIWEGVVILVGGTLIVGTVDNVLRPFLIGKDISMHPVLIFLSTLGGLSIFGFAGFIIGPVIASLFTALWDIFEELRNGADLSSGSTPGS